MAVLGIDLGTTNSIAAVMKNGESIIVPNRFGENLTPSVVSVLDSKEIVVGKTAKERMIGAPQSSAAAFKRDMGTKKKIYIGDISYKPSELSAIVLKSIVEDSEKELEEEVESVVITVPAYFSDPQRRATMNAAKIAGIEVIGLINEPTAAALAYHLHAKEDKNIVVIDFGGGTFDVSILEIFESSIEVMAISGNNHLGGIDFDEGIAKALCKKYRMNYEFMRKEDRARLNHICETFKINFAHQDIQSHVFKVGYKEDILSMSIKEFEEVCQPLLLKMKEPIKKALGDSKLAFSEIDEVILVGGTTKMPVVKNYIEKLFGFKPLCYLNPDEVVARGAAVYAGMKMNDETFEDIVMTDVCPFTLGVAIFTMTPGGNREFLTDPLIERNMTIPVSRQKIYQATNRDQRQLSIKVYQGEHRNPEDNIFLGEFQHEIRSGEYEDSATSVRFTYDRNGIFEVISKNMKSGIEERGVLLNPNDLTKEEIQLSLEKIANLKIHPLEKEENLFILSRAERIYELVTGERREAINLELFRFRDALLTQDEKEIKVAVQRINSVIEFYEDEF